MKKKTKSRSNNPWEILIMQNPSDGFKHFCVRKDGMLLEWIKNPSEDMILEALDQNGMAIRFVKTPTEEMKSMAIKRNGYAIKFIENPSDALKNIAITASPELLLTFFDSAEMKTKERAFRLRPEMVEHFSDIPANLQIIAVKRNYAVITKIEKPCEEAQSFAYCKSPKMASGVVLSEAVQLEIVKSNGTDIRYLSNTTEKVQQTALMQTSRALEYIKNPCENTQLSVVKKRGSDIQYFPNASQAVKLAAVQKAATAIRFIKDPDEELQMLAIQKCKSAINLISNPTVNVQFLAKMIR